MFLLQSLKTVLTVKTGFIELKKADSVLNK